MAYSLRKFVEDQGGMNRLSKLLGCNRQAIYFWLRGRGSPRLHIMHKMIKFSRGKLSYESMARETTRKLKGSRRLC